MLLRLCQCAHSSVRAASQGNVTNQYLFLLHEKPADAVQVSPAEIKEIIGRYKAWSASLAQRGLMVGGEKSPTTAAATCG